MAQRGEAAIIGRVGDGADKADAARGRRLGARSLFGHGGGAGRCLVCGLQLSHGDDVVSLAGYAVHTDCAAHRFGGTGSGSERRRP